MNFYYSAHSTADVEDKRPLARETSRGRRDDDYNESARSRNMRTMGNAIGVADADGTHISGEISRLKKELRGQHSSLMDICSSLMGAWESAHTAGRIDVKKIIEAQIPPLNALVTATAEAQLAAADLKECQQVANEILRWRRSRVEADIKVFGQRIPQVLIEVWRAQFQLMKPLVELSDAKDEKAEFERWIEETWAGDVNGKSWARTKVGTWLQGEVEKYEMELLKEANRQICSSENCDPDWCLTEALENGLAQMQDHLVWLLVRMQLIKPDEHENVLAVKKQWTSELLLDALDKSVKQMERDLINERQKQIAIASRADVEADWTRVDKIEMALERLYPRLISRLRLHEQKTVSALREPLMSLLRGSI